MSERRFDWDANKARRNRLRHRVAFEEATTVWEDLNALVEYDLEHSFTEERWRIIGLSFRMRLLTVIYTEEDEEAIRIISARRANPAEARRYASQG